jgi:hypothetical protein
MPDGMTYQPPRSHGAPCPRLMARAVALRSDAAEVAYHLGQCPNWQRERGAAMIANHQALMLRALAAEHMARHVPHPAGPAARSVERAEVAGWRRDDERLGVPMLRDAEDPDLAVLDGGDLGGVDRPHDVRRGGDDLPFMAVLIPAPGTVGREQGVLAHHAQEALAGDADGVAHAQAGPDLAMALARPGRGLQVPLDSGEQVLARSYVATARRVEAGR